MQTQCPHCETRFRVTESQVNTADGFVRCSVCEEVFNAFEVAEQDEHQPSLICQENPPQTLDDEPAAEPLFENEITDNAYDLSQTNRYAPDEDETKKNESDSNELTDHKPQAAEESTYQKQISDEPEAPEKTEAINFNKTPATADSRKDAFDFFNEDDNESLSHVVPEIYKESYADNSTGFLPNLLWGISALLLTVTLAFEYVWFNRDQLNQMPQLQTWSEKLCQHIECKNISMRNPAKIELVSRNVYSHPNEKNALMVNITMKNQADFAQPYPVMQIKFSDVRGGNVAARRFLPGEYLPAEMQQQTAQQLFEADTNMTFTMEIQDPGKQATAYEFDFL